MGACCENGILSVKKKKQDIWRKKKPMIAVWYPTFSNLG